MQKIEVRLLQTDLGRRLDGEVQEGSDLPEPEKLDLRRCAEWFSCCNGKNGC